VTTVAIVGTGRMGAAMARSLARSGHPLLLWNRTSAVAETLAAELGAVAAATPAEAAGAADVCLVMVADDTAVEEVFSGPNGLLAGVRAGAVLVDMSTVAPSVIRSLEDRTRATGAGILDAPVSGSVATAQTAQLTIMVGGEVADLDRARPALEPLAKVIFHLGPLGSGAAMKLAVNTLIFGLNAAIAEGLVLAEAAGIEPSRAYDVLAASAAGAPFVAYKRAAFLQPDTTPPAFALNLAAKDLRLILALAGATGVPMPQAEVNLETIVAAGSDGRGDRDFADVAELLRARRREAAANR
jgi:3-hydroxyisobutyrate dehydrogenase-like beta-hydroxyacid dehydrogenase